MNINVPADFLWSNNNNLTQSTFTARKIKYEFRRGTSRVKPSPKIIFAKPEQLQRQRRLILI
jgi:hypothetical protein